MKYGYARVSKKKQNLDLQLIALRKDGCEKIFQEKKSAKTMNRQALKKVLAMLQPGDTLVFWHIDRLGRNARELINLAFDLAVRGIALKSLTQEFDTTTPEGEYDFIVECANAQKEMRRISKRTLAGLDAARLRGSTFGRPKSLTDCQIERARVLKAQKMPWPLLASRFNVGESTMRRALANTVQQ